MTDQKIKLIPTQFMDSYHIGHTFYAVCRLNARVAQSALYWINLFVKFADIIALKLKIKQYYRIICKKL